MHVLKDNAGILDSGSSNAWKRERQTWREFEAESEKTGAGEDFICDYYYDLECVATTKNYSIADTCFEHIKFKLRAGERPPLFSPRGRHRTPRAAGSRGAPSSLYIKAGPSLCPRSLGHKIGHFIELLPSPLSGERARRFLLRAAIVFSHRINIIRHKG